MPSPLDDIVAFYAKGLERDRLANESGVLEFIRTQQLIDRYLPPPPATVIDAGGGPGRYAIWLAERGYQVHLLDPVPLHIEQARLAARERGVQLASCEVADARALPLPNESADQVLLLGPLYHLVARAERIQALAEARRVCRDGGVVMAAAISRFASILDGLRHGYLEDPVFASLAENDLRDGEHRNPTGHPAYFTTAYFHRPDELRAECAAAGLDHAATFAIEGPAWLLSDIESRLSNDRQREVILSALNALEQEPTLLGASAHLLMIARRSL